MNKMEEIDEQPFEAIKVRAIEGLRKAIADGDPNAKDEGGRTPLYWAARIVHHDIKSLLLEKMEQPQGFSGIVIME